MKPSSASGFKGPEGTTVKIKLRRLTGEEAEVTLERKQIKIQTVRGRARKNATRGPQ